MFCSIDPGKNGSYAIFDGKALVGVWDFKFDKIDGVDIIDSNIFLEFLEIFPVNQIFIEKVHAMTGQGVSSMFSFGTRFGEINALSRLVTNDISYITPQKWKSNLGLTGKDKKASAELAAKIYQDRAHQFVEENKRRKDGFKYYDGRGDAVCIGLAAIKLGMVK